MNRIAGLPNTESNRALDMYMKTALSRRARAAGIVFATGTPISNTMAEMYTLQRYLAPEMLAGGGRRAFRRLGREFRRGRHRARTRPGRLGLPHAHTVREIRQSAGAALDVPHLSRTCRRRTCCICPVPHIEGGKPHITAAPASPELKEYRRDAGGPRAEAPNGEDRSHGGQHAQDHRRRQKGRARYAPGRSRSPRFTAIPRSAAPSRRFTAHGRQERTGARPSLSSATSRRPIPTRFNVYDEIRDRLIAKGIPAKEIAYIHDAETDAQKKTLFDSVNAGRIRILLGSTEKMGAGTNVQKRLIALHHLDAPWRPRDIEQREGRILRQGNDNPDSRISTATSPKDRSTPICGRRWRRRPASSIR